MLENISVVFSFLFFVIQYNMLLRIFHDIREIIDNLLHVCINHCIFMHIKYILQRKYIYTRSVREFINQEIFYMVTRGLRFLAFRINGSESSHRNGFLR